MVEVFSAEAIDAVAGEFLTALIDKEALLKGRFWGRTESRDIELEELSGSGLQFDEAKAVALAQDGGGLTEEWPMQFSPGLVVPSKI